MYSAAARAVSGLTLRTVTPVIRQQSCAIRKFGAASVSFYIKDYDKTRILNFYLYQSYNYVYSNLTTRLFSRNFTLIGKSDISQSG